MPPEHETPTPGAFTLSILLTLIQTLNQARCRRRVKTRVSFSSQL